MKNYKSIRNFYEAMQQKPHPQEPKSRPRNREHHEKPDAELSFKKVLDFFKGIRP